MENTLICEAGRRLGNARLATRPVTIIHPQPVRAGPKARAQFGTPAAPGVTLTG